MQDEFKITDIREYIRQRLIAAAEKAINKDDSLRKAVIKRREELNKENIDA